MVVPHGGFSITDFRKQDYFDGNLGHLRLESPVIVILPGPYFFV